MILTHRQHQAIHVNSLVLFAFSLSVFPRLSVWVALVSTLNWLLSGNWRSKGKGILRLPSLLLIGLFLNYLLSLAYTDHLAVGWRAVETKLPLLAFPLLLFGWPVEEPRYREKITFAFVGGLLLAVVTSLGWAVWNAVFFGKNIFFYQDLGRLLGFHPTYFALYAGWALFLLASVWPSLRGRGCRGWWLGTMALLVIFLFLLAARMELLVIGALASLTLWVQWLRQGQYLKGMAVSFLAVIVVSTLLWTLPTTRARLQRAYEGVFQTEKTDAAPNIRLAIWPPALEVIRENFLLGVGVGDVQAELNEAYSRSGLSATQTHHLNAHNQFLQTFLALGVPGILLLLAFWAKAVWVSGSNRETVSLLFFFLFFLSNLTESMLETERGTLFFAFFACFLLSAPNRFFKREGKMPGL